GYYTGSADMRGRNLDRRIEVLVPVEDPDLRARLQSILDVNLADRVLAWELGPDGEWRKVAELVDDVAEVGSGSGAGSQAVLQEAASTRMRRWSDPDGLATPRTA